jgi:hypothetical protein
MIRFACQCKYEFEVPEEFGGRQLQCPQCKLLVDVPTQAELAQLTEEGIFRMEESGPAKDHFEELRRAYSKRKVDENGVEIDLRLTPEQLAAAGTNDEALDPVGTAQKYDPETGELIRPLEVRHDPNEPAHPSQIPMAHPTLNYATRDYNADVSIFAPLVELLMPINLVTMFFVLLVHLFMTAIVFSIYVVIGITLIFGGGLVAHYANVIEEIAIEQRNELPRFLRHFNLADDIWLPFCNILLAFIYCFLPAIFMHAFLSDSSLGPAPKVLINLSMVMLGLIFFPAAVLTTTTSGSILNLRPDRVLGTIAQVGARYAYFVIVLVAAVIAYYVGFVETLLVPIRFIGGKTAQSWIEIPAVAYTALVLGIYLMHYFAWILGLSYRLFHHQFPWVLQRHIREIPGVTASRYSRPARESDTFGNAGKSA